MKTMIDPPNGWMYGFPKQLPEDVTDFRTWLIDNGYPESEVDFAIKHLGMFTMEDDIELEQRFIKTAPDFK